MLKAGAFFTIYIVLLSLFFWQGVFVYEPWGQIEYLHDNGLNFQEIVDHGFYSHPHYLRFILTSVPFFISDDTGLDIKVVYSLYLLLFSVFLFLSIPKLVSNIYRVDIGSIGGIGWGLLILILISLLFIVNGRSVFALLGVALGSIVSSGLRRESVVTGVLFSFASLMLSSVSSGVFMISYALVMTSLLGALYYRRFLLAFFLFGLLYGFYGLVELYVLKILEFYHVTSIQGLSSILSHGILSKVGVGYGLLFAAFVAAALYMVIRYMPGLKRRINKELLLIVFIIAGFGVFGDLALSMLIIPLAVVVIAVSGLWCELNVEPPRPSLVTR